MIDRLRGPLTVSWQLTRDCNLACLHCCTESAPGKALPNELTSNEALGLVAEIVAFEVPYVLLCGGEPLVRADFFDIAEGLACRGVQIKVETNGHGVTDAVADRIAALGLRSVQVSLDGARAETFGRMRVHGRLEDAEAACRRLVERGVPLEVTFAPARFSIDEAGAVIDRAAGLGAFRLNTGRLMRVGTAARLWGRLEPTAGQYADFLGTLQEKCEAYRGRMEVLFEPFDLADELTERLADPAATMLVLPDGRVKLSGALPFVCADLRRVRLPEAWERFRDAWAKPEVADFVARLRQDASLLERSNRWVTVTTSREGASPECGDVPAVR